MMPHADTLPVLLITISYFLIAVHILVQVRWRKVDVHAATAMGLFVVIFMFCGLSGYLTSLLDPEWLFVRNVMHYILAAASIAFILTNRAKVIAHALERKDDDDQC